MLYSGNTSSMQGGPLYVSVSSGSYVCECCGLTYPILRPISSNIEARMHQPNTAPTRCARCAPHRQTDADALIQRAEDHAQWYWDHSQKAVNAARRMRHEVDEAEAKASDAKDRMVSAYRSRDHGTRLMKKIADLHAPAQRGCSCGKRPDCATAKIIDQGWVQERIRDLDRRDERERQRARQYGDDYMYDYDDDVRADTSGETA